MPAEVPPELAGKVLAADIRNVVTKVSGGGNLTTAERELMERYLATEAAPDHLGKTRLASLLRRWALGQRLNKPELDEIGGLLPDARQHATLLTRESYLHPQAHYEKVYGLTPNRGRTIKRWIKTGRDRSPPDLPPLDHPEQMAGWWSRCMTWTVPARLLTLAGSGDVGEQPAAAAPAKPAPADAAPASQGRAVQLPEGSGFAAAMKRAQEAERTAYGMWQQALSADPFEGGVEEMRRRAWERAVKVVREMERDAEDILSRDLHAWSDVEAKVSENLSVVNRSLRSILVRVATKIGLPHEWFVKADAAYQSELDRCFDELSDDDYRTQKPATDFHLSAA